MGSMSISFTLGKASVQHGANVEHNNREFIAGNIDKKRINENVTYVREDVKQAYQELFGKAVAEYNQKQKQPCRRIQDYYQHISNGKREEAFYEIVVQFGDSKTTPCDSENGKAAKEMLDEYIRSFRQRNPNLHIFNVVLHMDEASPHLHIDFIPFYEKGRKNGLNKGVSMKSALIEQGFNPKSIKHNQLVSWEASERDIMESILHQHGYTRDDKNAKYAHQTVDEYKKSQDEKKIVAALRSMKNISPESLSENSVQQLRAKLNHLENENRMLEKKQRSPYKSFYYSSPDKQAFVQEQLDLLDIPYRETENGFEAGECFVDEIRKIEKNYRQPKSTAREKLRDDIDRLLMQSNDFEELLERLRKENYTFKSGKYISVKPLNGSQFIRLKSLGEHYSEYALRNRINAKKKYESNLAKKINESKQKDASEVVILRTVQLYTAAFKKGALPMRKREPKKPFAWTNDSELDKLTSLNAKINSGATLETLRTEFEILEHSVSEKETALKKAKADLKAFYDLKEKIEIVFEGKQSSIFTQQQAEQTLKQYGNINKFNYHNIDILINNEKENTANAETALSNEKKKLEEAVSIFTIAEKVMGGTYVQSLVGEERERRESKFIPNGLKSAT